MNDNDAGLAGQHDLAALHRRLMALAALLAMLIFLAIAWKWTPLREWLDIERVVDAMQASGRRFGLLAAIAAFAAACIAVVPLTFLTLVTIVAFGPVDGLMCTLAGASIGGAASYWMGRMLGREVVERLAGERVNILSRRLAGRGLIAVAAVRLVPVAPFAVVNLIAGASHINFRDFIIGNALGMTPGALAMVLFLDQIILALKTPGTGSMALLALTLALIGAGGWGLRRWMRHTGE
ncbi:TVP38/TMEM64 family protein [Noviherbaspirillum sp. ST9]|uniref:TVP38/TMEM64 family protein n=1 Tax=Noviherbaspirillum sp. ST9 TaxID=3401606 RepID=UPI003B58682C